MNCDSYRRQIAGLRESVKRDTTKLQKDSIRSRIAVLQDKIRGINERKKQNNESTAAAIAALRKCKAAV